jgi:hypothetical protein
MKRHFVVVSLLSAGLLSTSASAAPSTRVSVGKDGRLVIGAAVVNRLRLKRATNGMVCVQFPKPASTVPKVLRPPSGRQDPHNHVAPADRPPKVFTAMRKDGSLVVHRSGTPTGAGPLPGRPGTVYVASVQSGCLVLTLPRR